MARSSSKRVKESSQGSFVVDVPARYRISVAATFDAGWETQVEIKDSRGTILETFIHPITDDKAARQWISAYNRGPRLVQYTLIGSHKKHARKSRPPWGKWYRSRGRARMQIVDGRERIVRLEWTDAGGHPPNWNNAVVGIDYQRRA